MEITLSAVIEAARLRRAGVTAEVAGYVVLLAVQALMRAPRRTTADALLLTELGELHVVEGGVVASERDVEQDLRQLLATLTSLAQSASPGLKLAAERAPAGSLSSLEAEVMAALIPLNHAAARRALSRLYRESSKSRIQSLSHAAGTSVLPTSSSPSASVAQRAATPRLSLETAPLAGDLEIEVDVVGLEEAPPPALFVPREPAPERSSAVPVVASLAAVEPALQEEPVSYRSDLRELLAGFLAHTRCEEQMTADLRRMIGLDAPPLRRSAPPASLFGVPTQVR